MKTFLLRTTRLAVCLFGLLVVPPNSLLAAGFSTDDLAGTWYVYTFWDSPFGNDPGWSRGTLIVNSSGTVTGGSLVDSDGGSMTVTGGSFSLNNSGVFTGSIVASGITATISHGKIADGETTGAFVGIDSSSSRFKGVLVKSGGSFLTSELAGTWYFHVFSDDPAMNDPIWVRGTLNVNVGGGITGGSLIDSEGGSVPISGGSLSVTSGGVLSGSITHAGGTVTISHGKIDVSKTMGALVGKDNANARFAGSLIKSGGTFETSELAGTWYFYSYWDSPFGNDPGWDRGTVIINSSGAVTGGSFADSDGGSLTITSGSFSLNSSGVLSGSLTFAGGVTSTISHGKLDIAKKTVAFVGTDTQGFRFQGNAIKATVSSIADFDGDGKTDIAVYQTNNGNWFWIGSTDGFDYHLGFGGTNYDPVPGDYDGDGKTDTAVYQKSSGHWFISQTTDGFKVHASFGGPGYIASPGDYDGDGKTDIGVYETSTGNWFWVGSTSGFGYHLAFGGGNFIPVPGDYDGDGRTDTAVYDTTTGNWYISQTTDGFKVQPSFGGAGFMPFPGDYDGDGKVDVGVYETSSGNWFYVGSTSGFGYHLAFGGANFIPVPGDYDGDGTTDTAVYDKTNGNWFISQTTAGFVVHPSFGGSGYVPVLPQVTILRAMGLL